MAITVFLARIIRKPPFLFPLVALFHLVFLVYSLWLYRTEPIPSVAWIQPLWVAAYTLCWVFVCDMKKWAAYGYLALTTANIVLFALLRSDRVAQSLYLSSFFITDILFCFFILFYFRRFE